MAAAWVVWSRIDQKVVSGPHLSAQDATDAIRRVRAKRAQKANDVYDSVSVTI